MSILNHKIDFVVLISANMANPNGDPLNGNRPRTDYTGLGEISDVCIKRKIRNRMQDMEQPIFVQSQDRCADGFTSLEKRAETIFKQKKITSDEAASLACQTWLDVRSFGQVFAFGKKDDVAGISVGVRGPVSLHQAVSISPVEVHSIQITKSVNGNEKDKKASDTMGMKHMIRFGFYQIKGSINVQLAQKTGFTQEDAQCIKECLRTLFENDVSSARPDGSMEVCKIFWWEHNCAMGQYSSAKVHRSISIVPKAGVDMPSCVEDYEITHTQLEGLACEELDGL